MSDSYRPEPPGSNYRPRAPEEETTDPPPLSIEDLPDVATAAEVARLVRMSRSGVLDAAKRGDLPSLRIGRRVLFPKEPLVAYLHGRTPGRKK